MRIWDINPGYLNRQSLLGEHCELHGLFSILVNHKKGYAAHPETLRWVGFGWALTMRHRQLSCEMALRGFNEGSPVSANLGEGSWPDAFIDSPEQQFLLLARKYAAKEKGRIPLPGNPQQLWAQHKYSMMARDPGLYKETGTRVSGNELTLRALSLLLVESLRQGPTEGGIRNAVQHMWGYVSGFFDGDPRDVGSWPTARLLLETQRLALANRVSYITSSTALSELMAWMPEE